MTIGAVRRRSRRSSTPRWPLVVLMTLLALSGAAYVALPFVEPHIERWRAGPQREAGPPPPVRPLIGGVRLTIPRDLVRFEHQRRDTDLGRIDLALHWPSLQGGSTVRTPDLLVGLIFISITPKDEALDPIRRFAAVYQRFLEPQVGLEARGLAQRRFRAGSGYDGEDLVYDPVRPGDFFVRCAAPTGDAPAVCMRELRLGDRLDVVVRFPRPMLDDWRRLDQALGALLGGIGAPQG